MKAVNAYIRHALVGKVIEALRRAGFSNMTLLDAKGVTTGLPAEEYDYSLELAEQYINVVRLEIVCSDQDADGIVRIIGVNAHTGKPGDGLVFVTPVDHTVRIATWGEDSEGALGSGSA
ncbi:MAG: P-II family nitrogen regulator [Nitrospirota bacterium]